jgi:hypothetical protein
MFSQPVLKSAAKIIHLFLENKNAMLELSFVTVGR